MTITTLSSQEFENDVGRAKMAAKDGPVFINDNGKPAYVLLTIDCYQQQVAERSRIASDRPTMAKFTAGGKSKMSIIDMLGMPPGIEDVELDIPRDHSVPRPADFD